MRRAADLSPRWSSIMMLLSKQGCRIRQAFSGDVGRGPVNGLEHGRFIADVGAADHAESADEACCEVAHHVAIEIRQQQHVELLRIQHHLHAGVVDDHLFVLDVGILRRDVADGFQEKSVRELHNIGFMDGVNFLSAFAFGVLESEVRDLRGCFFRDDLQAFDDAGNDFVFQSGIEIFRIFANQNDIHVFKTRFHSGKILDRPDIGVKIERFS